MTDNERVLHTVLSECLRAIPDVQGDKIGVLEVRIIYLENRLEEIAQIVKVQVEKTAYTPQLNRGYNAD